MRALPSLGFVEAVKLASSRFLDFKGRSRRSEFWWWMLVVLVGGWAVSLFASNLVVNAIITIGYMFLGLSATARRLHDSGKSAIWLYISYVLGSIYQVYFVTSETMASLMEELEGGAFSQNAIMKILENGAGDVAMLSLLGFVWVVFALIVLIMCLFDSTPAPNKYGDSPKYVED